MQIVYHKPARKELKKLDPNIRDRIIKKLEFFANQEQPKRHAKKLVNSDYGDYRFRVGDWRILCDIEDERIIVLAVGHRREIYR